VSDEPTTWDQPGPIHLVRRNPATGRIGSWNTPTHELQTVCAATWHARPNRTLRLDLITCATCLSWAVANPDAFTEETYSGIVRRVWNG
jgi:hypothetical protein